MGAPPLKQTPRPALATPLLAALLLAGAARAEESLFPIAVGQTKGGIRVVAVQGGPWGVVELVARTSDADLTAAEHRALDAVAYALADGSVQLRPRPISQDVADAGGRSRARAAADVLAVSVGAPMERFDVALKAMNDTLAARARLLPASRAVDLIAADDPAGIGLDPRALALLLPGTPHALPTAGATIEPPVVRAVVDKLVRRERVVLAVVGPAPASDLLATVMRVVTTPLLPAPPVDKAALSSPAPTGTRLFEQLDPSKKGARATLWLFGAGRGSPGASPKDRAARSLLARLLGGHVEGTDAAFAVALAIDSPKAASIARAEGTRVRALLDVARTPPPQEVLDDARTQERVARLSRLKDAEAVADALARALLAGDAGLVEKEIAALAEVTPADVARAAKQAASGPRVVVRTVGAP